MTDKRRARVESLKAEWKAGLSQETVTFDSHKHRVGWCVRTGPGQDVLYVFNERVSEWLFEETQGYRAIGRRFGPWNTEIGIAVQFKSVADAVNFHMTWL